MTDLTILEFSIIVKRAVRILLELELVFIRYASTFSMPDTCMYTVFASLPVFIPNEDAHFLPETVSSVSGSIVYDLFVTSLKEPRAEAFPVAHQPSEYHEAAFAFVVRRSVVSVITFVFKSVGSVGPAAFIVPTAHTISINKVNSFFMSFISFKF